MALTQQRSEPQPASGAWTYDDLLALPDDGRRWEIVEGVLYEMPAPPWIHSVIVMTLAIAWGQLVRGLGGMIATAPTDVFLRGANPVQPDIMIALPGNPGSPGERGYHGVPDLIVEVLSPSTRGHDTLTKRSLYARAGVREYWLVDPDARSVEVLSLDGEAYHTAQLATGDDVVRSRVLPEASLPMAEIFSHLAIGSPSTE